MRQYFLVKMDYKSNYARHSDYKSEWTVLRIRMDGTPFIYRTISLAFQPVEPETINTPFGKYEASIVKV